MSARTCSAEARPLTRHPGREVSAPGFYMSRYQPDGKRSYRLILQEFGYQDGLDVLHHLTMKGGKRAVRAILYRPPPRVLLFQPALLAQCKLDDPPEADSILGFLSPAALKGGDIYLAANPGKHRYFGTARSPVGFPSPRARSQVSISRTRWVPTQAASGSPVAPGPAGASSTASCVPVSAAITRSS